MCSIFYSFYLSNHPLPKLPYLYNFAIHVLSPNHLYTDLEMWKKGAFFMSTPWYLT